MKEFLALLKIYCRQGRRQGKSLGGGKGTSGVQGEAEAFLVLKS